MPAIDLAHFAAELAEEAAVAPSRQGARDGAIARLRSLVGFETVYWGEPLGAERDPHVLLCAAGCPARDALVRFAADRRRSDVPHAIHAIRKTGGVAIGHEVFTTAESDQLPVYAEVLRPAGIRSYIFCD